jgi:hypothetical protein
VAASRSRPGDPTGANRRGASSGTAVRELEPALFRAFNPCDEITTAPALAELLACGSVNGAVVEATTGEHLELDRTDEFWDIILGSCSGVR